MRLTQVLPEVRTNTKVRGREMSALFRSRRDQRVKLANEFGQAFSGHAPDALYQNLSVLMGKDVPLAMIALHGISGWASLKLVEMCLAASPIT